MTRESAIAHLAHKVIGCKTCGESKADGVVAWMPLPEPWEDDKEWKD